MAVLANQRGGPAIRFQALSIQSQTCDLTPGKLRSIWIRLLSGHESPEWFWQQYIPNPEGRTDPRACPLRTSLDELGRFGSGTSSITAECDVLRDEGEAYARRLAEASVPQQCGVRWEQYIPFCLDNALAGSTPTKSAFCLLVAHLRAALCNEDVAPVHQ